MAKGDSFTDVWAVWRQKAKTSKATGKVARKHFRVDLVVPYLAVNLDAKAANAEFGTELKQMLQEELRGITREVAPSTVERRERAARDRKSKWYRRRYQGGRMGELPPAPADGRVATRYALDSSRLVESIHVQIRDRSTGQSAATINVAANRLDPRYFGGAGAFRLVVETLRQSAPMLAGKFSGDSARQLRAATEKLARGAIAASEAKARALKRERDRALVKLLMELRNFAG